MRAISLLGTGTYESTTYTWREGSREQSWETHLFPEAVARIFRPDRLVVLVTPKARKHANFKTLQDRLGELVEPVSIPEGKSDAELWDIFERVSESLGIKDEIVLLDVTHALRSLQLMVFVAAAYQRSIRSVTIQRIVYGAYEAREGSRSPIFDLTPLLDLLDWLSGTDALLRRSDSALLASKLVQTHRHLRTVTGGGNLPSRLQNVATHLERLSRQMHLGRPLGVMATSQLLLRELDEAASEIGKWAKPFATVLERVRSEVASLALDRPELLDIENLRKQLALIEHYLSKGLVTQAVTLAREWVVSWALFKRDEADWMDRENRERIEKCVLSPLIQRSRRGEGQAPNDLEAPDTDQVADTWEWLTDLRNDLAHCGMRKGAASAESIDRRAREVPQRLGALLHRVKGDVPEIRGSPSGYRSD